LSLREYQAGSTEKATDPIDGTPTDRGAPVEQWSIALVIWSKEAIWRALLWNGVEKFYTFWF